MPDLPDYVQGSLQAIVVAAMSQYVRGMIAANEAYDQAAAASVSPAESENTDEDQDPRADEDQSPAAGAQHPWPRRGPKYYTDYNTLMLYHQIIGAVVAKATYKLATMTVPDRIMFNDSRVSDIYFADSYSALFDDDLRYMHIDISPIGAHAIWTVRGGNIPSWEAARENFALKHDDYKIILSGEFLIITIGAADGVNPPTRGIMYAPIELMMPGGAIHHVSWNMYREAVARSKAVLTGKSPASA